MFAPRYSITNDILRNISYVEACREVIDHAPLIPAWEKKFQEDAMVRTVHHGTHIEGNGLDIDQAEQVLQGNEVMARSRDIQEVINYRAAMQYLDTLSQEKDGMKEITEEMVKQIHTLTVEKLLEASQCGQYRKTQVVIRNSQTGIVSFRPPGFPEVPSQMLDFIHWINSTSEKDIHPVLKAGIAHYELARIHPFVDGNGRVARALSTLVLFKEGYDIRRFFSLEEYFDSNSIEYYESLQSVEKEKGDLTTWLSYFTKGVAVELTRVKDKIHKLSIDTKLKTRLGHQIALSDRQIKIIEYMQEIGYLQNKAFPQLFPMVSEDTILRELQELVRSGIIKKIGVTKGAKYILAQ
jgi:Fic family protein